MAIDKYDYLLEFIAENIHSSDIQKLQQEMNKPAYAGNKELKTQRLGEFFTTAIERGVNKSKKPITEQQLNNFEKILNDKILKEKKLITRWPNTLKKKETNLSYVFTLKQFQEGRIIVEKGGVPERVKLLTEKLITPKYRETALAEKDGYYGKLPYGWTAPKLEQRLKEVIKLAKDRNRYPNLVYIRNELQKVQYAPPNKRTLSSLQIASLLEEIDEKLRPTRGPIIRNKTVDDIKKELIKVYKVPEAEFDGLSQEEIKALSKQLAKGLKVPDQQKFINMNDLPRLENQAELLKYARQQGMKLRAADVKLMLERANEEVNSALPYLSDRQKKREMNLIVTAELSKFPVFDRELLKSYMKKTYNDPYKMPTLEDTKKAIKVSYTQFVDYTGAYDKEAGVDPITGKTVMAEMPKRAFNSFKKSIEEKNRRMNDILRWERQAQKTAMTKIISKSESKKGPRGWDLGDIDLPLEVEQEIKQDILKEIPIEGLKYTSKIPSSRRREPKEKMGWKVQNKTGDIGAPQAQPAEDVDELEQ